MSPAARLGVAAVGLALLAAAPAGTPPHLSAAVDHPDRPAAYLALDASRRPAEVLAFLGVTPGDRVLDYDAAGGYYTEILAEAVGPRGLVVGWVRPGLAARPQVAQAHTRIRTRAPNATFIATPMRGVSFPADSFDVVLVHLVYHEAYWESREWDVPRLDPDRIVRAIYHGTKPGGVVGVIDHAGLPGVDPRVEAEKTHRIDPAIVRRDFEQAGFVLEAETDLLRAPADDRTRRIFEPGLRGATDRFVFRFRKPLRRH